MPMPSAKASFGERIVTSVAVNENLAVVGRVDAREHIHQRGFPTAVFAQKRQDFAPANLKGDVVVGDDLAKTLGNALHPDCRRLIVQM